MRRIIGWRRIEPVIAALNHGVAFQRMQVLNLPHIHVEPAEFAVLLDALTGAPCASQLTSLKFE